MTNKGRRPKTSDARRGKPPRRAGTRLEQELAARQARAGAGLLSDEVPQRLDPRTAAELAPITGADPGEVRLHTGTQAERMADRLGARAFALASGDVFFAKDAFQPDTPAGKALLAHELTHVAEGAPGQAGLEPGEDTPSEQAARQTESMVLAQEDTRRQEADEELAEPVNVNLADGTTGDGAPRRVRIDKTVLEEKVHRAIDRALRRDRERHGR
jgi:hypothetical protein